MTNVISIVSQVGASSSLISDLQALEANTSLDGKPIYSEGDIRWLANVITGKVENEKNKDMPLFHLCHLASSIAAISGAQSIAGDCMELFLSGQTNNPERYKSWFHGRSTVGPSDNLQIIIKDDVVSVSYAEGETFNIDYKRMPKLAALFEFLSSMDQFSFYQELGEILDGFAETISGGTTISYESVQKASNRISSVLRQYRKKNMPRAHLDDKFVRIHKFVTEKTNRDKTNTGTFLIEDDDILNFWQQNSNYEEFKVYRSVFDNFVVYMKAYVEAGLARNFFNPSIVGANREENEVEPQSTEGKLGGGESWESPLHIFDEKPTSEVKFFKQKNERAPIEQLMKYGPYANSLPIAFLRTETFGAVQSGITNDLQIKRGAQSIKNRITCNDATSYDEIMEVFEDIFEHVKKLELASLHAISKRMEYNTDSNVAGNVVNLFEKKEENNLDIDLDINIDEEIDTEKFEIVMREAEIAFKELTRMGFSSENLENDMYIEAFRIGAGALINIKYQFERFFRELSKLQKSGKELSNYFVKDKQIFSNQFEAIYGENL